MQAIYNQVNICQKATLPLLCSPRIAITTKKVYMFSAICTYILTKDLFNIYFTTKVTNFQ